MCALDKGQTRRYPAQSTRSLLCLKQAGEFSLAKPDPTKEARERRTPPLVSIKSGGGGERLGEEWDKPPQGGCFSLSPGVSGALEINDDTPTSFLPGGGRAWGGKALRLRLSTLAVLGRMFCRNESLPPHTSLPNRLFNSDLRESSAERIAVLNGLLMLKRLSKLMSLYSMYVNSDGGGLKLVLTSYWLRL